MNLDLMYLRLLGFQKNKNEVTSPNIKKKSLPQNKITSHMKSNIFYICILLSLMACSNNNDVRIELDKKTVLPGEKITARLYVNNSDSIAPAFYIVREFDTVQIEIDHLDKDCGIYRAIYKTPGEKVVNGYVDFLDKQNKWLILHFSFKYQVVAIPENLPERQN
jgi:hypothetical protein